MPSLIGGLLSARPWCRSSPGGREAACKRVGSSRLMGTLMVAMSLVDLPLTRAGCAQVLRRLDNVDDKVKAFFAPAAKAVLDNSDAHNALAAALAALSGIIEVPKQRRCAPNRV